MTRIERNKMNPEKKAAILKGLYIIIITLGFIAAVLIIMTYFERLEIIEQIARDKTIQQSLNITGLSP